MQPSVVSASELLVSVIIYLGGSFIVTLVTLYCYLRLTSTVEPDLELAKSEMMFLNPKTSCQSPFPRTAASSPTLYMSLVVPAYKEQDRLPKMMNETMTYLEGRQVEDPSFSFEVIIVNDGSPDKTAAEAMHFVSEYGTEKVRLLNFVRNRGKGGAVRMGSLSARGQRILFLDADGASEIKDMPRLETALDEVSSDHTEAAIAIGSRAHLQEEAVAERSFVRNLLMHSFHLLVYLLCVRGIKDTQCGFKMMTRSAAVTLYHAMHINRWAFDVELLYIAQKLGMPVKEVAINWQEIDGSKMVPVFSWIEMGRDLLFIWARYTFHIWTINTKKYKEH